MQWRTIIFDSDNWIVAECSNKEVALWAISDMPWLTLRSFPNLNFQNLPVQIKTHSWTSAEISDRNEPPITVIELVEKIKSRISILDDLYHRTEVAQENLGISSSNFNLLYFYEYLAAKKIIDGDSKFDSEIKFENTIQILQDLDNIKTTVISLVLKSQSEEQYQYAVNEMERLFLKNILL